MSLKWKIFRVANIIEIILITGIAAIAMHSINWTSINTYDFLGFVVIFFFSASVVANGVNNIALLQYLKTKNELSDKRKTLFWMLSFMLFLTAGLATWGSVDWYLEARRQTIQQALATSIVLGITWTTAIAAIGFVVLYLQVVLFYETRRLSYETASLFVDRIGKNDI